jgi:DNA-directed RNA polymerase specialized sigma24 family protein
VGPSEPDLDEIFTRLIEAHATGLARFAHQLTLDVLSAEHVVRETLLRLYSGWQRTGMDPAVRDLPAYVRHSVTNEYVRRSRLRLATDLLRISTDNHLPAVSDTQDELVIRDWAALDKGPVRQWVVLVLRHYESLPDAVIALGRRQVTVRSLANRGMTKGPRSEVTAGTRLGLARPQATNPN